MATPFPFTAGAVLTASQLNSIGLYEAHATTFTGFTLGNGTRVARYCQINEFVHYWGKVTLGSTSSVTGQINIDLPISLPTDQIGTLVGSASFEQPGVATWTAEPLANGNDSVGLYPVNVSGTYGVLGGTSATVPMTWASGHKFSWNLTYEIV